MPRRPKYKTKLHGVLPVDKPLGVSSAAVVRRVRFAAGNCKTGHAGTLDPLATGLVVCCLGDATKLVPKLMGDRKVYRAAVDLSTFSTTDDAEGEKTPVEVSLEGRPDEAAVRTAASGWTGWVEQVPPAYSAVHVDGQRAYKLARAGEAVELPAKRVHIASIEVMRYNWPSLELEIACGKGVYIRSLARDLGKALGTGGYLTALRRTEAGRFHVEHATPWDRLDKAIGQGDLMGLDDIVGE